MKNRIVLGTVLALAVVALAAPLAQAQSIGVNFNGDASDANGNYGIYPNGPTNLLSTDVVNGQSNWNNIYNNLGWQGDEGPNTQTIKNDLGIDVGTVFITSDSGGGPLPGTRYDGTPGSAFPLPVTPTEIMYNGLDFNQNHGTIKVVLTGASPSYKMNIFGSGGTITIQDVTGSHSYTTPGALGAFATPGMQTITLPATTGTTTYMFGDHGNWNYDPAPIAGQSPMISGFQLVLAIATHPSLSVSSPVTLSPIIVGAGGESLPTANITVTETSNAFVGSYSVGSVTGNFTVAGAPSTGNALPQGGTATHAVGYSDPNTVGIVSGSVAITGEDPTTGSSTVALSGRVYAHAAPVLAVVSPTPVRVIKGTAGVTAGLTLTNTGVDNAPADVQNLTGGLSGPTGSGVVVAGGSAAYTAALNTATAGLAQSQSFGLDAGDQQSLPGASALTAKSATVTVDVLEHASSAFANVAGATGILSDAGKTLSLDFGTKTLSSGTFDATFNITNVGGVATAKLDLLSISPSGSGLATLTKQAGDATFINLAASGTSAYTFRFDTSVAGTFSATYTFNLADEAGVIGGTADPLTLNLAGIVSAAMAPHPGDANSDGTVNFLDYNIVKTNYLSNGVGWDGGDLNDDGTVNFLDYNIVKTHYLHTNAANGTGVQAIPEPATLALLALAGLAIRRKRQG